MRRSLLALAAVLAAPTAAAPAARAQEDPPEIRTVLSDGWSALVLFGEARAALVSRRGTTRRVTLTTPTGAPDELAAAAGERGATPGYVVAYRRANRAGQGPAPLYSRTLDRSGRLGRAIVHDRVRAGAVVPRVAWTGSSYTVAWLAGEGLVVQRVAGRAEPRQLVAPRAESFVVTGESGSAWVVWSELDPAQPLRQRVLARRIAEEDGTLGPPIVLRPHVEGSRFGVRLLDARAGSGRLFALVQHESESRDETLELVSVDAEGTTAVREVARTGERAGGVRGRLALGRGTPVVAYRGLAEDGVVRARVQSFAADLTPGPRLSLGIRGGPGAFEVGLDGRAHTLFHERRDLRVASVPLDGSAAPARRRVTFTPRTRESTSALAYGRGGRLYLAWSEGNRVAGGQCPRETAFARVLRRSDLTPVRRLGGCTP